MPLNILTFSPSFIRKVFVNSNLYNRLGPPETEMVLYVMYTDEPDGCKINKARLRVYREDDGEFRREITTLQRGLSADDLSPEVQERFAVLLLAEPGTLIEDIGWRVRGSITVKG